VQEKIEKKLVSKFKFLEKNPERGPYPYNMFGIECGDGWYDLLSKLCTKIDKELKKEKIDDFSVNQIKDKFGGLRFYVSQANENIHDLIQEAENKSYKICEMCGKKGNRKTIDGWIYTLCKPCEKKVNKDKI